jgi:hypothetical protein
MSAHGILGGPPKPPARCPRTGRIYEDGSGALSHEEQTAMFLRQQAIANDMPREGEYCPQTGRPYQCCSGALTKTQQTAAFLAELPPAAIAERQAAANALAAVEPEGHA